MYMHVVYTFKCGTYLLVAMLMMMMMSVVLRSPVSSPVESAITTSSVCINNCTNTVQGHHRTKIYQLGKLIGN